jgi:hypothetical protein
VVLLCANSLESLESLVAMRRECELKAGPDVVPSFLLVLTKADLGVSDELRSAAQTFGLPVFEVSAKTGAGCAELREALVEHALRGTREEWRRLAAQQAAGTVIEMFDSDRTCFAGVPLPRDVVEHCLIPAVLATGSDQVWDRVGRPDEQPPPAKSLGVVGSLVGWVKRGLGWTH